MLTEFKLPSLGENVKSGVVTKVMVKVGDAIQKDQPVIELETEKAVLEVPCPFGGVVKEVLIKTGQEVKVGQSILKIETEAAKEVKPQTSPVPKTEPKAPPPTPKKEEAVTPRAVVTETKASVAHKSERTTVVTPQPLRQPVSETPKDVAAAPSVRRFAREIGIEITLVPGSGPSGRISIDDVKAFAKQLNTATLQGIAPGILVQLPDFSRFGPIDRQPMTMIRKTTSERLSQAWQTIPHVTQFDKADITELEKVRKRFSEKVEKSGGKLTITSFILKVLATALKSFPQFNASIDVAQKEIIYKKYYHVGVAVDTDRGLLVPVIRDVDKKTLIQLSVELTQIAERARNKKTTLEEMQGGTFTITNLGSIGGIGFTPIINSPEVAILGVVRARLEPVYLGEHFTPRLLLPLCLSYDHRLIDGADGARFLRFVVEALEQPFLTELEG